MEKEIHKIKLIILGSENVGKTSLTHSILEGSILEVDEDKYINNLNESKLFLITLILLNFTI